MNSVEQDHEVPHKYCCIENSQCVGNVKCNTGRQNMQARGGCAGENQQAKENVGGSAKE